MPPASRKSASTGYRPARHYAGSAPIYAEDRLLRFCACWGRLSALTFAVLISGIVLLWAPGSARHIVPFLHKASFVLWFGAMTVHVLGHLGDTFRLAPRCWVSAGRPTPFAGVRRAGVIASLVAGAGLGWLALGQVNAWLRLSA